MTGTTQPADPAPAGPPPRRHRPKPIGQRLAELAARLAEVSLADAERIGGGLSRTRRMSGSAQHRELDRLAAQVDRATRRVQARRAASPPISFPPELPVTARVEDLAAAITGNQVVIVAGETGSGKSTQLPKICLQLGRGVRGQIGHTQPRRIAARALAERIAEETGTELGGAIGYTIRFGDHTGPGTLVKLMTDGILLAEIGSDPDLLRYDTIIVDEAHERSLNIDFLLGYLTRLLPRRPDLKVIITSATIDPDKFSRHFSGAPVVEVSGRTYPVQIRYRPYGPAGSEGDDGGGGDRDELGSGEDGGEDGDEDRDDGGRGGGGRSGRGRRPAVGGRPDGGGGDETDQPTAIARAVDELFAEGDGDILVFLSGEREITDTADALRGHLAGRPGLAGNTEVLPLYGRLSMADQHRVFASHHGRRIVLATNVAETSLTVPGIRYVIDPGTARISRYSTRTKVAQLPIERISRASAGQRAGRCGRVADGICIRLYSQEDFEARSEFTDPEIGRTSLASVILRMAALGLGDVATFPFLDPPDTKQITDGIAVLTELGALERDRDRAGQIRLTATGRAMAALPVDPRLARIMVEGDRRGCLAEILVIVAALAIRDVREYPLEERAKAVAAHARFADARSDFLALVNLWHYLKTQAKALSGNGFRRMCRTEYLHYLRIREWQDLHAQLVQTARGLGMAVTASARIAGRDPAGDGAAGRDPGGDGAAGRDPAGHGAAGRDPAGDGAAGRDPGGAGAPSNSSADLATATRHARSEELLPSGRRKRAAPKRPAAPERPTASKRPTPAPATAPGPATQQGRGSAAVGVDRAAIHTALAAGLLSHVGARIERDRDARPGQSRRPGVDRPASRGREYQGTRGTSFAIWPGSALARTGAPFVIAAELVATSRLWARTVAAVDPGWVELVGGDLLRRSYSEPHWSGRRQAVLATEKVMLLGVTLVAGRAVQYDRIDPVAARELFIRYALVQGELSTRLPFLAANQAALDEVAESERRTRRHDIAIDDEALFALYDARIPPDVTSGRHLESWWRKESRHRPDLMTFTADMLIAAGAELASAEQYPDRIAAGDVDVALDYVFEPGAADDGVSATVPLAALPALDPDAVPAAVPGMRTELAVALIRSLPKTLRRLFVPAPDVAAAALDRIGDDAGPLPARLAAALRDLAGTPVAVTDFDLSKVPDHLRMTFTVVDDSGRQVASGKDLAAIQRSLRVDSRRAVAKVSSTLERAHLTGFPAEGLAQQTIGQVAGLPVTGYPALVDEGSTVGVRVLLDHADQARAMRAGTRRLLVLRTAEARSRLAARLGQLSVVRGPAAPGAAPPLGRDDLLLLATAPHRDAAALLADVAEATVDALLDWAGGPAWDAAAFDVLAGKVLGQFESAALDVLRAAADVLRAGAEADRAIEAARASAGPDVVADMRAELAGWLRPGFVTAVGAGHLPDAARYLRALSVRAGRIHQDPGRDRRRAAEIAELRAEIDARLAGLRPERLGDADVTALHRLLAEYRVALHAQPMRTAAPVSDKRIRAAIAALPD